MDPKLQPNIDKRTCLSENCANDGIRLGFHIYGAYPSYKLNFNNDKIKFFDSRA